MIDIWKRINTSPYINTLPYINLQHIFMESWAGKSVCGKVPSWSDISLLKIPIKYYRIQILPFVKWTITT